MSHESGLPVFRGEGGIWNDIDVAKVATKASWYSGRHSDCKERRQAMLDFFNPIRRLVMKLKPNEGHSMIASLEHDYDVTVITQNGDDYHERAGSHNVIHLHGEALKNCSTLHPYEPIDMDADNPDIHIGDKAPDDSQIRPYVIFFDEDIDMRLWKKAVAAVKAADVFVVVGSSLLVYPAVNLLGMVKLDCMKYLIDPVIPEMPPGSGNDFNIITAGATEGLKMLISILKEM
jgi:NAD-dependent deacetylase